MIEKIFSALKIYKDKRMLIMLALGFSSGLPLALVAGTLVLWLKGAGVALSVIGGLSLIKTPFSFKWLWAPLVDKLKLPILSRFGQLRSWAIFSQIVLMLAILGMSFSNVQTGLYFLVFFAVVVVFSAGTQDIVLDAYRINIFKEDEQAAGAAIFTLGYRLGMIFSGAGALFLSDIMPWQFVYQIMSLGVIIGLLTILLIKEPQKQNQHDYNNFPDFFKQSVIAPFVDFIKRPDWKVILLFIFFYRMSDAYMGQMTYAFFDDLGFSKTQIATASKIYGIAATILGGFIGGMFMNKVGMYRGLFWCAILQSISNFVYVIQAKIGYNFAFLCVSVAGDNIASGMATIAFVAYLSSLCNKKYAATQYALLSSLMALSRDIFAATSGKLAEVAGWNMFFVLTVLMGIPALLLLRILKKQITNKKNP